MFLILCLIYELINLYFFIPAVITQNVNPVAELVIPIGILSREAKAEMKINPVIGRNYNK